MWRLSSGEAPGVSSPGSVQGFVPSGQTRTSTDDGVEETYSHPWVWVDLVLAWGLSTAVGGVMQLGLWTSIVPSLAFLTTAVGYAIWAEEVRAQGRGEVPIPRSARGLAWLGLAWALSAIFHIVHFLHWLFFTVFFFTLTTL